MQRLRFAIFDHVRSSHRWGARFVTSNMETREWSGLGQQALEYAVQNSRRSRCEIAAAAGVTERSLRRWTQGRVEPGLDNWITVITACGTYPGLALLTAERCMNNPPNIDELRYIQTLINGLLTMINTTSDFTAKLDYITAKKHLRMIIKAWQTESAWRQDILAEESQATDQSASGR